MGLKCSATALLPVSRARRTTSFKTVDGRDDAVKVANADNRGGKVGWTSSSDRKSSCDVKLQLRPSCASRTCSAEIVVFIVGQIVGNVRKKALLGLSSSTSVENRDRGMRWVRAMPAERQGTGCPARATSLWIVRNLAKVRKVGGRAKRKPDVGLAVHHSHRLKLAPNSSASVDAVHLHAGNAANL